MYPVRHGGLATLLQDVSSLNLAVPPGTAFFSRVGAEFGTGKTRLTSAATR